MLPISNSKATSGVDSTGPSDVKTHIINSSVRSFLTRILDSARHLLAIARPWKELIDRSAFSRPDTLSDAVSRVRRNFSYFRVNYMILQALMLAFSLFSHPFTLIILALLITAWLFLYTLRSQDQPVIISGRILSDRETLGILCVATVVVVFLTSVGSLLMSTITVGAAIVGAHGAFRVPEDLFLDEQESLGSGFLSFVASSASSTVISVPAIASRV